MMRIIALLACFSFAIFANASELTTSKVAKSNVGNIAMTQVSVFHLASAGNDPSEMGACVHWNLNGQKMCNEVERQYCEMKGLAFYKFYPGRSCCGEEPC